MNCSFFLDILFFEDFSYVPPFMSCLVHIEFVFLLLFVAFSSWFVYPKAFFFLFTLCCCCLTSFRCSQLFRTEFHFFV
ncbi:Uncharacterized protein TCM_027429 [Theobroma cacao]|uniref:Uncharacterized protein n=1 Tax=Theobroma cacao TaxID=3641 RepID=A0A061GG79_THECC|nr:Uncharacterized protein TCM_027429 [Theobroma cacao]